MRTKTIFELVCGNKECVRRSKSLVFPTPTFLAAMVLAIFSIAGCEQGIPEIPDTPVENHFTLGGVVEGLAGNGLQLEIDELILDIEGDGPFTFSAKFEDSSLYEVSVKTQPAQPAQTCTISQAAGRFSGKDINDVNVKCVIHTYSLGGDLNGLAGGSVTIHSNGESLSLSENGEFTFTRPLQDLSSYEVKVVSQPTLPSQTCSITSNAEGLVNGSSINNISVSCSTNSYAINGVLSGLQGGEVLLSLNDSQEIILNSNGEFNFENPLPDGMVYTIQVASQPDSPSQVCELINSSGTVSGASVDDVIVNCTTNKFEIGGTVNGLVGEGLTLQLNDGSSLAIAENGVFNFPTALADTASYSVNISSQPTTPNQICNVVNSSGTLSGESITNIEVVCSTDSYTVGGTVTGLVGSGLLLQNNAVDYLSITQNGNFSFNSELADQSPYNVTILSQPASPNQICSIYQGNGSLQGGAITNVQVSCVNAYRVGLVVSGLLSGNKIILSNNGTDDLVIQQNGSFAFDKLLINGNVYDVSVESQPSQPKQVCKVSLGTGIISLADVSNITVQCELPVPNLTVTPKPIKTFQFSWEAVDGADEYRLMEDPDSLSGYSLLATLPFDATSYIVDVPVIDRVNARYILQACNDSGCTDSVPFYMQGTLREAIGYFKASNTHENMLFGTAMALSDDGQTLAVGAAYENSASTGINGNQGDRSAPYSGAVYIFRFEGGLWKQTDYIKASNTDIDDHFGESIDLSGDGNTLVVGAPYEDSFATGINGSQTDDSLERAGAAYIFHYSGTDWTQEAYIKPSNSDEDDRFGTSVAINQEGDTLVIGAPHEDSSAEGVEGDQNDNSLSAAGAIYVFTKTSGDWMQSAYLKPGYSEFGGRFGSDVSIDNEGVTVAVSTVFDSSSSTGVNSTPIYDDGSHKGAAYVFTKATDSWIQQAYIKASNADSYDRFGVSLSLSGDGKTLAIGADSERSQSTGINGNESDNSAEISGAIYVFKNSNGSWSQQAYVKASNTDPGDRFGSQITLSENGDVMLVAASGEDSEASGINGNQNNSSEATNSGAVYLFKRSDNMWSQSAYLKAANTKGGDDFGRGVAISSDGSMIAIGAPGEDSGSTGIGGNQEDTSRSYSGAVYVY